MILLTIAGVAALIAADTISIAGGPVAAPAGVAAAPAAVPDTAQGRPRPKAVEMSDAYETRLRIHRIASYATLPLFAVQYAAGQALFNADANGSPRPAWAHDIHRPAAYALSGLFLVNTVTGAMNWWETRSNEKGRAWRTAHALLMLASDAGFAYTATVGTQSPSSSANRATHRNWAIGSSAVALAGYVMMLDPIRRDQ